MSPNDTHPLVSVCIPLYNHENYVEETIQSVIEQEYKNIELIIIDDGSIDNSVIVVNKMLRLCQSRFVRFEFIQRDNKGLCTTLNEGVAWCEGKYFSAIASDDVMLPAKTSALVDYLESNQKCGAVFGQINLIDSASNQLSAPRIKTGLIDFDTLLCNLGGPPAPAQLIRMDAILQAGKYRSDIFLEDLYMWLAIAAIGHEIVILDFVVTNYRSHSENITKNYKKMLLGRLQIANIYKNSVNFHSARSTAFLMAAHELLLASKKKSLDFFFSAIREKPEVLLKRSAVIYIFRMALPNFLYELIAYCAKRVKLFQSKSIF